MRTHSKKGFSIEKVMLKSKTLSDLRIEKLSLKFDADLNITKNQPGTGKTYDIIKMVNDPDLKKSKDIIFSKHHNILSSEYDPYIKNVIHWHSFNDLCQDEDMKKVKFEQKLMPKTVCRYMCKNKDSCPYLGQFKSVTKVTAPIQFIHKAEGFSRIFIDENFMETDRIVKDLGTAARIDEDFRLALVKNNSKWMQRNERRMFVLLSKALEFEIKNENWKIVEKLESFNIKEQAFLIRNKMLVWYRPKIYKIFDIIQGKSTVILASATFPEEFFIDMLKSYSGEIGFKRDVKIKIYESEVENKNTIIYNINPEQNYRKGEPNQIIEYLDVIVDRYPDLQVIGTKKFFKKNDIQYGIQFGNAEGLNEYQHNLALLKTKYYTEDFVGITQEYNKFYDEKLEYTDFESMSWKWKEFSKWRNEAINYDSLHRNRGLIYNRVLFVFGAVTNKMKKEFTVIKVDAKTPDDLEFYLQHEESKLREHYENQLLEDKERLDEIEYETMMKMIKEEEYMNIPEPIEYEPEEE